MAFQSAPDCAAVEFVFTQAGRIMENVLNFRRVGGYAQVDIDALATAMDIVVDAAWLPNIVDECSYVHVIVTGLENQADLQAIENTNAGPGQLADTPLPLNVTIAHQFTTGFTGRSSRGRMYIVGLSDTALVSSKQEITTTKATAWNTAITGTINAAAAIGWDMVVLSRVHNGVARVTAQALDVTGHGFRDLKLDSQRNRLDQTG
jgi:hypothetical protein